jgi:hypothetical protein
MSSLLDVKQKGESDAGILLSYDRFGREVDANRCWLAVHINLARAINLRTQHRAQKKRRSVGPPLLRMSTDLFAPPHHL